MQIYGFELKNVERHLNVVEYTYIHSSDIMYNNVKVGSYYEDFFGGPSNYKVDEDVKIKLTEAANQYFDRYPSGHPYRLGKCDQIKTCKEKIFLEELADLHVLEKNMIYWKEQGFNYDVCFKKGVSFYHVYLKNESELTEFKKDNDVIYVLENSCFNFE